MCVVGQGVARTQGYLEFAVVPGVFGAGDRLREGGVFFDLGLGGRADYLLDSGVEIGGEVTVRLQRSAPDGIFREAVGCPPQSVNCPQLAGSLGRSLAPVSPATGLTTGFSDPPERLRSGIDTGVLVLRGGWGEVSFGRDSGVGVRLDARAPSVWSASGPTQGLLDPLGYGFARARNDPSGVALKASFLTPRLFGLRAGISVTPGDAAGGVSGPRGLALTGLMEMALSFSYSFAKGLEVRSAATWSVGSSCCDGVYGQYHAAGLGLEIEQGSWRYGGRWLLSNNARSWDGQAYQAIELGIARVMDDWEIGMEVSAAADDLLVTDGYLVSLAVMRHLSEGRLVLGLGAMHGRLSFPHPEAVRAQRSGTGVLAEARVRIERHR